MESPAKASHTMPKQNTFKVPGEKFLHATEKVGSFSECPKILASTFAVDKTAGLKEISSHLLNPLPAIHQGRHRSHDAGTTAEGGVHGELQRGWCRDGGGKGTQMSQNS